MNYVILNFPRTQCDSLSISLNLSEMFADSGEIFEFKMDDFYSSDMLDVIKKFFLSGVWKQQKAVLIGINYPILDFDDKEFVKEFLLRCLHVKENYCFHPKPGKNNLRDDFSLFYLQEKFTFENYEVENLFKRGLLGISIRNKIHPFLRDNSDALTQDIRNGPEIVSKKIFNLSCDWQEYEVPQEVLRKNLLDRVNLFYPSPETVGIELTNQCNLSCVMCFYHSPVLKKTQKTDFFKTAVKLEDIYMYRLRSV